MPPLHPRPRESASASWTGPRLWRQRSLQPATSSVRVGPSCLARAARSHVLFGVYLWLLIQDNADSLCGMCGFGAKIDYPSLSLAEGEQLLILKPDDFGSTGYAERRSEAIDEHFKSMLPPDRGELLWRFDYWIEDSTRLRDYLWAHDPFDVEKARTIVEVLTRGRSPYLAIPRRQLLGEVPRLA